MPGTLFIVATPIGNLEDITLRALRILREVDVIAAEDTRRTAKLLARHAIATRTTSLHEHNERQKTPRLLDRIAAGESVALVTDAGTPLVSDPGAHLIRSAIDRGLPIVPIPGPSAALAALVASGLSGEGFTFAGFPPRRSHDRNRWFAGLANEPRPLVFFEAPHRIRQTLEQAQRAWGDRAVVVGRELTKVHEELVRGPISWVLQKLERPVGEFTVVVAPTPPVSAQRLEASDDDVANMFGQLTKSGGVTRREAVRQVSARLGLSAKEVYAAIERAKA
jgi:16S rRNA (cytidine1402-2'-O)-methyltransferase